MKRLALICAIMTLEGCQMFQSRSTEESSSEIPPSPNESPQAYNAPSQKNAPSKPGADSQASPPTSQGLVSMNEEQTSISEDLVRFKMSLENLEISVAKIKRDIAKIKKALRSGLDEFQDNDGSYNDSGSDDDSNTSLIPNYIPGDTVRQDALTKVSQDTSLQANSKDPEDPLKLLSKAQIELDKSLYAEATRTLEGFKKFYPNSPYDDLRILLEIRIAYDQKNYDNALDKLRNLYLQFPQSYHVPRAKMIEAQIYIKTGYQTRAEETYQYIINTYPTKQVSLEAKKELEKLRNRK
jgi:TolA-binding protein